MATKAELELREILLETGQIQPLKVESKGGRISALCRQLPGQEKAWLVSVESILRMGVEEGVNFHLCRKYVLKDDRMVFGWNVGIEEKSAKDLDHALGLLRALAANFQPAELVAPAPSPAPRPPTMQEKEVPAVPQDLAARAAEIAKHTDAHPRPADQSLRGDPVEPRGYFQVRTIAVGTQRDQKNRLVQTSIEEMPLPHVFTDDMNRPNDKRKGAWAGGTFAPDFGRRS